MFWRIFYHLYDIIVRPITARHENIKLVKRVKYRLPSYYQNLPQSWVHQIPYFISENLILLLISHHKFWVSLLILSSKWVAAGHVIYWPQITYNILNLFNLGFDGKGMFWVLMFPQILILWVPK